MNLLEELKSFDPSDPGRWPLPIRGFFVLLVFVVVRRLVLVHVGLERRQCRYCRRRGGRARSSQPVREQAAARRESRRLQGQLADMERTFGAMFRQLPGKTEVPNLLVDISQTGLAAGLTGEAVPAGPGKEQWFLCRAADQDPAGGQLPSVRRFRLRHRGAAAHRDAPRHPDHPVSDKGQLRQPDHGCNREDLSVHRGRGCKAGAKKKTGGAT